VRAVDYHTPEGIEAIRLRLHRARIEIYNSEQSGAKRTNWQRRVHGMRALGYKETYAFVPAVRSDKDNIFNQMEMQTYLYNTIVP